MIHALLVAALAAPLQDPPPAEPPAAEAAEAGNAEVPRQSREVRSVAMLLDSVELIINDECITFADVQLMAAQQGKPAASREEYIQLLQDSAEELTRLSLMAQAGRDLGYDEAMVRSMVRDELDRQKEVAGSVAALAQELDRVAFDSVKLQDTIEQRIYRDVWQGAVTGKFQGPTGRPYVDRFVRPGLIRLEFERQRASLDLPTRVQLSELTLAPALGESPESTRQKAQLVRSRLANGEDFYELNAQFGIPGQNPDPAPIEEDKLAALPEVKAFVEGASPGDISEALPILREGQLVGFRILRFVGRQEGKDASFVDRELQSELAREVLDRRDRIGMERALGRIRDAAYVWPPELVAQPGPGQPAPAQSAGETPEGG